MITEKNFPIFQSQILEIERLSFQSPWSSGAFVAETKKSISNLWGLTTGKSIWGYICFWMLIDEIQLANIAVHPLQRGQGYAQTLLTKMLEISMSHNIKNIWLEVRPSNQAAKYLYCKFGFYEVGRRPRYYSDTKEDAIVMALELPFRPVDKLSNPKI